MIELGLESFELIGSVTQDKNEIRFPVQVKGRPVCPRCGIYTAYRKARKTTRRIVDVPMNGKRVLLLAFRQQFHCLECGSYYVQPMPDVDKKKRMTNRTIPFILEEFEHSFIGDIAEKLGVTADPIRRVCLEYLPEDRYKALALRNIEASRRKVKPDDLREFDPLASLHQAQHE